MARKHWVWNSQKESAGDGRTRTHPLRPYNTTTQRLHSCSLAAHTPTITDRPHPVVVSLSTIASFAMEDLRRKPVRYPEVTTGPIPVVEFEQ
ncbi:hypothetical protein BD310DRAFT_940894 [Dichomitus squalens]|uniref:Uncharacterized protein n=1 Tax=Dichomitus squalens TaxID=114155 RepID=A0A4Q9PC56_9APHY|nr:hypothetical protein BD310DRAFT_940894 [Dichomitus squalens]